MQQSHNYLNARNLDILIHKTEKCLKVITQVLDKGIHYMKESREFEHDIATIIRIE